MSIKKYCIKCGDIFHGGLYETLCGACQMSAAVTPMFKLCPDCDGAYGAEWDMCPVCYPVEIVSNTKSNTKSHPCLNCGTLGATGGLCHRPECDKKLARAAELKSGIQEKIDFGGIKLVPEQPFFKTSLYGKPGKDYWAGDVKSGNNYTGYNSTEDYTKSGQDAYITSAQIHAVVAALKGSAIKPGAILPWPVEAVEVPEDYTGYKADKKSGDSEIDIYVQNAAEMLAKKAALSMNEILKNCIEYNEQKTGSAGQEPPVYDDNGVPITQAVKTP